MELTKQERKLFSKMGTLSRSKRFAGMTKTEISKAMSEVRRKGIENKTNTSTQDK